MIYAFNSRIWRNCPGEFALCNSRIHEDIRDLYPKESGKFPIDLPGRQSGSLDWRRQRDELGETHGTVTATEHEESRKFTEHEPPS